MSKPQQGKTYKVVKGDTVRTISRSAYGRDLASLIIEANYDLLNSRKLSDEGIPYIYPGDILDIPLYTNRYNNEQITADYDTQVQIIYNGTKLSGAKATRIGRQMNQLAFGFVFDVPYDPYNADELELFRPKTYYTAQIYIGGELYLTCRASHWSYSNGDGGQVATIECRTLPGDMLECMGMRKSNVFQRGITLIKICQAIAKPYGITCYSASGTGGVIDATTASTADEDAQEELGRIEQEITQTDAEFLQELVKQKGFLVTSMSDGNLLICRANINDSPVCALIRGKHPFASSSGSYDGTKQFSKWMGITESDGETASSSVVRDSSVSVNRGFVFTADDAEPANLSTAIKWRISKSFADSQDVNVTVSSWRNAAGELWEENKIVTVWDPSIYILRETRFLISAVELTKDTSGGDIATLTLVIPESYSNKIPASPYPWEGDIVEPSYV